MQENIHTIELVTFPIHPDASDKAAREALASVNAFVSQQPGFAARYTGRSESGEYVDIVLWESLEQAKAASQAVQQSPTTMEAFRVIDMANMKFAHYEVFNRR